MEPKKYVKGKHQRTDWGHGVKEFRKMKETTAPKQAHDMKLEISIDDETARGRYANLASVVHTDGEFILDFLFLQPGQGKAKVHTRIISSPQHTKRLMAALADNIHKYEARFGPIGPHQEPAQA